MCSGGEYPPPQPIARPHGTNGTACGHGRLTETEVQDRKRGIIPPPGPTALFPYKGGHWKRGRGGEKGWGGGTLLHVIAMTHTHDALGSTCVTRNEIICLSCTLILVCPILILSGHFQIIHTSVLCTVLAAREFCASFLQFPMCVNGGLASVVNRKWEWDNGI